MALRRLEDLGVRVPDSSRLRSYEKRWGALLDGTQGDLSVPAETSVQLPFDYREMDEVAAIIESLPEDSGGELKARLRDLTKGGEHPDDSQATISRDSQFELFLHRLLRTEYRDVTLGTPDLLCPGLGAFIEAKRPGSLERLDDRARKGLKLLDKQELPGVLAISVDELVRPKGTMYVLPRDLELSQVADIVMRGLQYEIFPTMLKRLRDHPVAAIWLVLRLPVTDLRDNRILLHTQFGVIPGGATDTAAKAVFAELSSLVNRLEP